jgi:hypothetical protein
MVAHQAKSERIGNWLNMQSIELQKIGIVSLLDEDILTVVAAGKDVIVPCVKKGSPWAKRSTASSRPSASKTATTCSTLTVILTLLRLTWG